VKKPEKIDEYSLANQPPDLLKLPPGLSRWLFKDRPLTIKEVRTILKSLISGFFNHRWEVKREVALLNHHIRYLYDKERGNKNDVELPTELYEEYKMTKPLLKKWKNYLSSFPDYSTRISNLHFELEQRELKWTIPSKCEILGFGRDTYNRHLPEHLKRNYTATKVKKKK